MWDGWHEDRLHCQGEATYFGSDLIHPSNIGLLMCSDTVATNGGIAHCTHVCNNYVLYDYRRQVIVQLR